MASCISRFKSEAFKKHVILAGYAAGRRVDFALPDPIEIQIGAKKDTGTDYMSVEGVDIVSDKLKSMIEDFGVPNVEFFKAEVELFNKKVSLSRPKAYSNAYPPGDVGGGEVLRHYWWMNLWNKVDVIDRERSIGEWVPGVNPLTARSFPHEDLPDYLIVQDGRRKIVLNGEVPEHLFWVEGLHAGPFVSPTFSRALEAAGMVVSVHDFPMRRGLD